MLSANQHGEIFSCILLGSVQYLLKVKNAANFQIALLTSSDVRELLLKKNHDDGQGNGIWLFLLLPEKFQLFDWLRAEIFQLNLKHVHLKIIVPMVTEITT